MKKCSVFMAQSPNQSIMSFCKVDGFSKEEAREQIKEVLKSKNNAQSYNLNYIGVVDFNDMDHAIAQDTTCFEKHDPVWLLNVSPNQMS